MRRTKVVATLGPASASPETVAQMIAAGVDVVRFNTAHATPDELTPRLVQVRAAATAAGRHVAVLVDLAGPKIRLGEVEDGTVLIPGSKFTLTADDCRGDVTRACIAYAGLAADVSAKDRLLIDDGRIELVVEGIEGADVVTRVVSGGPLESRKGVNVPGVTLSVDPITDADRSALAWAQESGVDWIGQSFVRSASDVRALRALMGECTVPIMAKIEKHEAADDIDAIVEAADGVMVARGDLAVETAPERVPVLQRCIVAAARESGCPVVIATEMLDSMRTQRQPTRAEASDVANAIFSRADAVMLSGETAMGAYPVESVETMVRIIEAAEQVGSERMHTSDAAHLDDIQTAMSAAACELAGDLGAAAIIPLSQSGATALAVARYRPSAAIIAVTPSEATARKLAIVWGVHPEITPFSGSATELFDAAVDAAKRASRARAGDIVVLTAGLFSRTPGGTDMVHARVVP